METYGAGVLNLKIRNTRFSSASLEYGLQLAATHLTHTSLRKAWKGSYPHLVEGLHLPVQGRIDILHVEERVTPDLAQQIFGEVAHVVLAEVPLAQDAAGDDRLGILVAALAEILPQVLAVPQPLDVIWPSPRGQGGQPRCGVCPAIYQIPNIAQYSALPVPAPAPECSTLASASSPAD